MKKLKKSTGLTVALLIYVSATAAYFLPRNTEISNTEKCNRNRFVCHRTGVVAGAAQKRGVAA